MDNSDEFPRINYVKQAADHLRTKACERGLCTKLGSGHAHSLIAAALGYKTPPAMKEREEETDQWIGQRPMDVPMIVDAIQRMNEPTVTANSASQIADIISVGLTPACVACEKLDSENTPVGDPDVGDECEWICTSCVSRDEDFGECSLCRKVFRVEDLDHEGLCPEHRGEFDYDPEELQDREDYVEYLTKDND